MTWHEYHESTKHSVESLRLAQHVLDWANMPDPFRHYEGVPVLEAGLAEEIGAVRDEIAELADKQRGAAVRSSALVRKLRAAGLSGADTAAALKVSPQRVSQLLRRTEKAS